MDMTTVLAVLEKGLTLLPVLIQAGEDVAPTIEKLIGLASGAKSGTITDADVTQLEAQLDAQIADFNSDLPAAS